MDGEELASAILKEVVSAKVQSQTAFLMVTALRQTLASRSQDFDKEYVARMEMLLQSIPAEMNPATTLKDLQSIVQSAVDKVGQS